MKKIFLLLAFAAVCAGVFAEKSKLTIKNVFGADKDEFGKYDFYSHKRETDINGDTVSEDVFALGDRFQVDYESGIVNSRVRLEVLYHHSNLSSDEIPSLVFAPSGYVCVTPIKQLGIAFGNNFYKKFTIKSGYLAAADDTTKYARLLTDSLGYDEYFGSSDVSVYYNGYGGGLAGNFCWGQSGQFYFKPAAACMFYTDADTFDYSIDFGLNGGVQDLFDIGFTAHNVIDANRKFGAFAGLCSVPNLILNAGFYYNFTLSNYLPEARVERNDVDEFKKQKTKYALGFTAGYKFEKIPLGIYFDFITGLTNEYIGTVKYYDGDGNLVDSTTKTIVRGGTCVKYNNGVAKRTDEFTHEAVPYYAALRLSYDASQSVNVGFRFILRSMWRESSQTWMTFYPNAAVELPSSAGKISAGIRIDMNLSRYEGVSAISVPLAYTYKFKKKFK